MENGNILNNFSFWTIIKNISITNIKRDITISELATEIKMSRYHPYFCKAINYLIDIGIIKVVKTYGKTRILNINIKKLDGLIEGSPIYKEFQEYIHNKKIIYADI